LTAVSSVRLLAVILAIITGVIHLVLFFSDLGIPNEVSVGNLAFALSGIIYLVGAGLILVRPSRKIYYLGAVFAILNIIFYFPGRLGLIPLEAPPVFEAIGISDKLIEIVLVITVLYLARVSRQKA